MDILWCMGMTVLSSIPKEKDAAQKACVLMRELAYTPEQQRQFSQSLKMLGEEEIKAFTKNVLLPQVVTERGVKDQLSDILDIFDPRRRNSEPSRSFLMLVALYTYGYAIRGNRRVFSPVYARRYIDQCLKSAWDIEFLGREEEDGLARTTGRLIDSAFAWIKKESPNQATIAEQWIAALKAVCASYREEVRSNELSMVSRYAEHGHVKLVRDIACGNPLMIKLVSGGWEF